MDFAIAFAETGHLCLATIYANSPNQALDRIVHFLPEEWHQQLLMDLSLNLKARISQHLIPIKDKDTKGASLCRRGDHAEFAANLGPDLQGRRARDQGDHEKKSRKLGHADFRPGAVGSLRGRCAMLIRSTTCDYRLNYTARMRNPPT